MADYHTTHSVPGNLVIRVAGESAHEQALDAVTRLFGDWEPRTAPHYAPSLPPTGVPRVAVERRKTEQTNFVLLMPGLRHDDPRYFTRVVFNAILGHAIGSRTCLA